MLTCTIWYKMAIRPAYAADNISKKKNTLTEPIQTFQLGVQAMKVLHPSDEPVEERFIPILSTTSVDMSKDDSAIAGFSTFDLGLSPAKKTKLANEQRHKGGKGKEKEKMD